MPNILVLIAVIISVIVVGGLAGYFLWIKTRPKKIIWKANVYQLGEGIRPPIMDKKGKIISDIKLRDLRPYTMDILEKLEKDHGVVIYRLVKLNKVTPQVTSDCVDYWGEKDKRVSVLLHEDTCTLLKKGYDNDASLVFNPMPHDRTNMIKSEIAIRKDRLHKEKDILQAITPWIITGICIIGLIGISYILGSSFVEMSENIKEAMGTSGRGTSTPPAPKEPPPEVVAELPPLVE